MQIAEAETAKVREFKTRLAQVGDLEVEVEMLRAKCASAAAVQQLAAAAVEEMRAQHKMMMAGVGEALEALEEVSEDLIVCLKEQIKLILAQLSTARGDLNLAEGKILQLQHLQQLQEGQAVSTLRSLLETREEELVARSVALEEAGRELDRCREGAAVLVHRQEELAVRERK